MRQSGLVEAWGAVHKVANVPSCCKALGSTGLAIFSIAQMDLENTPLLGAQFLALY